MQTALARKNQASAGPRAPHPARAQASIRNILRGPTVQAMSVQRQIGDDGAKPEQKEEPVSTDSPSPKLLPLSDLMRDPDLMEELNNKPLKIDLHLEGFDKIEHKGVFKLFDIKVGDEYPLQMGRNELAMVLQRYLESEAEKALHPVQSRLAASPFGGGAPLKQFKAGKKGTITISIGTVRVSHPLSVEKKSGPGFKVTLDL